MLQIMLKILSEVTTVIEDISVPIGGQIWMFDSKIKLANFKYVSNIVGKDCNVLYYQQNA